MKSTSSRKKVIPSGSVFGRLTLLEEVPPRVYRDVDFRKFKCSCECGVVKDYEMSRLLTGRVKSCGCYARERIREAHLGSGKPVPIGLVCHLLTVVREVESRESKSGKQVRRVLCSCECGVEKTFDWASVRQMRVKCCGCKSFDLGIKTRDSHMRSRDPVYKVWSSMKRRCDPANDVEFPHYAGRGIAVCERWMNFENFIKDMGERPEGRWTIERVDNQKGYSKSNCRWANYTDQLNNTRKNVYVTYRGETKSCSQWARELGVNKKSFTFRVLRGWPIEEIFSRPYTKSNPRKFGRKASA